jgi:hypothetical protein
VAYSWLGPQRLHPLEHAWQNHGKYIIKN